MKAVLLFPFVMIAFIFMFLYAFITEDKNERELA
jgi:hypothetical protein